MVKSNNNNTLRDRGGRNPYKLRFLGGFTLAEVLITIGIIGVVAAMVIPSLISSFQKKIYYSKFMKARMVVENALKLYTEETGYSVLNCNTYHIKEFSKYFNVATYLTTDNYQAVCKKYKKVAFNYDGKNIEDGVWLCSNDLGGVNTSTLGFITQDGMLLNLCSDQGAGAGRLLDVNGPNNGPNTFGRDIFLFYSYPDRDLCNSPWGLTKACNSTKTGIYKLNVIGCYDNKDGSNCAARLIEEGKMNY